MLSYKSYRQNDTSVYWNFACSLTSLLWKRWWLTKFSWFWLAEIRTMWPWDSEWGGSMCGWLIMEGFAKLILIGRLSGLTRSCTVSFIVWKKRNPFLSPSFHYQRKNYSSVDCGYFTNLVLFKSKKSTLILQIKEW